MIANKSFKILSLEAKDLYAAADLVSPQPEGYSIRDKNGNISLKKFENALDWSLDTIKLQDAYTRETRKRNFYFVKDKKAYTQVIASVKFSYSYKEFNKAGQNTYVRHGYNFRDCVMNDGACVKDGKLVAIQTNIEINNPLPDEMLCGYFAYANGCYNQVGTIPVLMNKSELRQYLYEHGFVCDGIKYVRYKRSSGSSRVGAYVWVEIDIPNVNNKHIKDAEIYVTVACHKQYMKLDHSIYKGMMGNRRDNITRYIDKLINNSPIFGIGNLTLKSVRTLSPYNQFIFKELTYTVPEFNVVDCINEV